MSKIIPNAQNNALTSGLAGLRASGLALRENGQQVYAHAVKALEPDATTIRDTVTLSEDAKVALTQGTLEGALIGEQQSALLYAANGKVVEGAKESWASLMNVLA